MRYLLCLTLALSCLFPIFLRAAGTPIVTDAGRHGSLNFEPMDGPALHAIEWCPVSGGPWRASWAELQTVVQTNKASVTVRVPMRFRVVATPLDLVAIPGGSFNRGKLNSVFFDGDEQPRHSLGVSPFQIGRHEVRKSLWDRVQAASGALGYEILGDGGTIDPDRPVHHLTWYDILKWCNALSELTGRTPCYYTDTAHTSVFKTGWFNLTPAMVDWNADGFRLPTEAEWECAASMGGWARHYPWGQTLSHVQANYYSTNEVDGVDVSPLDVSPTSGYHPDHIIPEGSNFTSRVGSFAATPNGLYDVIGNVWEYCFDVYQENYYASTPDATDPRGPDSTSILRVIRGGSFTDSAPQVRIQNRLYYWAEDADWWIGFRYLTRSPDP